MTRSRSSGKGDDTAKAGRLPKTEETSDRGGAFPAEDAFRPGVPTPRQAQAAGDFGDADGHVSLGFQGCACPEAQAHAATATRLDTPSLR